MHVRLRVARMRYVPMYYVVHAAAQHRCKFKVS